MIYKIKNGIPQLTKEHYEKDFAGYHFVHDVVTRWAEKRPDGILFIDAEEDKKLTWKEFDHNSTVYALKLLDMGFEKGDIFVTVLPQSFEHLSLEYACFKIGVIFVPLDLRLKAPEVIRSIETLGEKVRAFTCLGTVKIGKNEVNYGKLASAAKEKFPNINHYFQFTAPDDLIEGAMSIYAFDSEAKTLAENTFQKREKDSDLLQKFARVKAAVSENDGCLVIFTTGSTGFPKPAFLSHRGITYQNMVSGFGLGMEEGDRILVNLPPSHAAGQTEALMSAMFMGATCVLLHLFDPEKSLKAIQDYKVNKIGQIPAMFSLMWQLPNYHEYDLSSLEWALYSGQAVTRKFLEQLSKMAPKITTCYGLTECSGLCTFASIDSTIDEIFSGVGVDMPAYPMSIRKPMNDDGSAGEELLDGSGNPGDVCFKGDMTFIGYINNEEKYRETVSSDGYIYTGDFGYKDDKGLHLQGRSKFVIKPKGYQIDPHQVEEAITKLDGVVNAAVVGHEHDIFTEGIVAFVEAKSDANITVKSLEDHMKSAIASYMRPSHYIIMKLGEIPLNRVEKTDYMALKKIAEGEVKKLREKGGWDKS